MRQKYKYIKVNHYFKYWHLIKSLHGHLIDKSPTNTKMSNEMVVNTIGFNVAIIA